MFPKHFPESSVYFHKFHFSKLLIVLQFFIPPKTCVSKTDMKKDTSSVDNIINQYTKLDPTLPRIKNIECPNKNCPSNIQDDGVEESKDGNLNITTTTHVNIAFLYELNYINPKQFGFNTVEIFRFNNFKNSGGLKIKSELEIDNHIVSRSIESILKNIQVYQRFD